MLKKTNMLKKSKAIFPFRFIKNKKGMSVLEVLVSSVMTLVIFSSLMYFFSNTEAQIEDISLSSRASKSAIYIAQTIMSQSKSYQFYPKGTTTFANKANDAEIFDALAFSINRKGELKPVSECESCTHRIGISVIPLSSSSLARGLFDVWIMGIEKVSGGHTIFVNLKIPASLI